MVKKKAKNKHSKEETAKVKSTKELTKDHEETMKRLNRKGDRTNLNGKEDFEDMIENFIRSPYKA